jgi:hemin uptake protein HemP
MLHTSPVSNHSASDFSCLASDHVRINSSTRHNTLDTPPLPSEGLLKGHKVVEIVHNGNLYKLQATKLGKLILTK